MDFFSALATSVYGPSSPFCRAGRRRVYQTAHRSGRLRPLFSSNFQPSFRALENTETHSFADAGKVNKEAARLGSYEVSQDLRQMIQRRLSTLLSFESAPGSRVSSAQDMMLKQRWVIWGGFLHFQCLWWMPWGLSCFPRCRDLPGGPHPH